ncbi:site-specific recombinase [Chitinilyticum litopenaei]|uniref:site-specific recombinase n=1 Tax=Chitinilyticum litopenaei TaxID=1121276 RepID=UPI00041D0813|nr:site-specific recombinase [Chitinilyticum litopenaei]
MESILQTMVGNPADNALPNLGALVDAIRPRQADDSATAVNNLRALSFLLEQNESYRLAFRQQLEELLGKTRQVQLYTDTGILSNEPLLTGLRRRIGERLLPIKPRPELLKDVFGLVFHRKDDHVWLAEIPYGVWADLCRSLLLGATYLPDRYSQLQRLEAIQVLSCRIATIGLEPELVQNAPDMERFESPFVRQNVETLSFVENYRKALVEEKELDDDQKHIMVLLDQCTAQIARIRKHALKHGVSVSLTYHLLRLEQHIERMQTLLELVDPIPSPNWGPSQLRLFLQLVKAENRKHSLRDVLRQNTELLALQVTEHASHTGEHYITESRREWLAMFRAAAGAGIIVGFMALLKILITKAHLPPLIEAVAFGLNYGIGFIIVHLLHCTIATKQPAMTAATIAATLPPPGSKSAEGYRALVDLIVKVARTQFIAIMGNVLLAMPVALALGWLWAQQFGEPVVSLEKAGHLLHDLRPIEGFGLAHAAIAGVWLFLAGLISGYYDNKALYHRLPERIAAHPLLVRVLGEHRAWRLGRYVEHNLGALAGNFYFGMMLGLTGFVGFLLGLPLDIRHITFSSANIAFVAVAVDFNIDGFILLLGLGGVAVIGATNLIVSFTLALWTAMRSRQRLLSELRPLLGLVIKRFFTRPQDFFIAPRQPKAAVEHAPADEGKA